MVQVQGKGTTAEKEEYTSGEDAPGQEGDDEINDEHRHFTIDIDDLPDDAIINV